MKRMGVDNKLIDITKSLYRDTVFCVGLDGYTSDWLPKNTGIRQGCPLSPYLFLIVMTTLVYDVHQKWINDYQETEYQEQTLMKSHMQMTQFA